MAGRSGQSGWAFGPAAPRGRRRSGQNGGMSHLPINHHLQPLYRVLAGACGLYIMLFGVVGLVQTGDRDFFAQDGLPWILGLRANAAFASLSVVAGVIVLGGAVIGR